MGSSPPCATASRHSSPSGCRPFDARIQMRLRSRCWRRFSATVRQAASSWSCVRSEDSSTTSPRAPSTMQMPVRSSSRAAPTRAESRRHFGLLQKRFAGSRASPAEIERARAYLAGRLERAADDPRGLAEWHASQRVLRRAPQDLADLLAEIESVRPADLLRVARRIVRGGALRVGLSAPRPAIAAVRREARRGVLEVAPRRPSPSRSARLSA